MKDKLFKKLRVSRELSIIMVLAVLVILISLRAPVFLSLDNLHDIAVDVSILAIMAIGMMMVIVTEGIDISVGANLAFTGMVVAIIISNNWNISPAAALLMGIVFGSLLGAFNGLLIVGLGINAIIATLGTMNIFRGMTFIINFHSQQGSWISADKFSEAYKNFTRVTTFGIPNLILIAIIVYIVFYYMLYHTRFGRNVFAIGSNVHGAEFVGINVKRVNFLVYVLNGALAGLGGVLWVSRYTSAQTDSATGFEFVVITAAILGGTKITGGSGSAIGVLFGSIIIGVVNNALNLANINPFWKSALNGAIVLVAVIVDKVNQDRNYRKAIERRPV